MWMDNGLVTGRLAASVRPNRTARPFLYIIPYILLYYLLNYLYLMIPDCYALCALAIFKTISNPLIFCKNGYLLMFLRVPR